MHSAYCQNFTIITYEPGNDGYTMHGIRRIDYTIMDIKLGKSGNFCEIIPAKSGDNLKIIPAKSGGKY